MKEKQSTVVALLFALLPAIYLWQVWSSLPATVPLHFGMDGKPDGFGEKQSLIYSIAFLTVLAMGCYLVLANLNRIDPKKARNSAGTMRKMALATLILMVLIQFMIIHSATTSTIALDFILLPALGLFFAFVGNILYSVKPNYFIGIRTPWALEDERNWRHTHQLAGKLWFGGGLLIALLAVLLPFSYAIASMIAITTIITFIPAIYSFRIFKQQQKTSI